MTKNDAFQLIKDKNPPVIFLAGKTSTGKTTFSKELVSNLNYATIELDDIVMESVVKNNPTVSVADIFVNIYKGGENKEWQDIFIQATKDAIEKESKPVIVEGALADTSAMKEIVSEDVLIVFMHPDSIERYIERLISRFKDGMSTRGLKEDTGLPKVFWNMVNQGDTDSFIETGEINSSLHKSFESYATLSQQESLKRLERFQSIFKDVVIIYT